MRISDSRGLWVKICGITNEDDLLAAIDAGASAVGFVFAASPRELSIRKAARLRTRASGVAVVGVFSDAARVAKIAREISLDAVQLPVDAEIDELPSGVTMLRSIRLRSRDDLLNAPQDTPLHIDSFVEGTLGGTGIRVSTEELDTSLITAPWILAGGLNATNVADATQQFQPDGVDVSSGVEREPGIKNHQELEAFIANARTT